MIKNIDWTTGELKQEQQEEQNANNHKDEKGTSGKEKENKEKNKDNEKGDSQAKKEQAKDHEKGKGKGKGKDKDNGNDKDKEKQDEDRTFWGVDSASMTTKEVYACVNEQFGKPKIWGRYLGTKEDVSQGITKDESQYLREQEIKILMIYNHFNDARGYDQGVELAKHAVSLADDIGLPKEKAIFADIEPDYPVDASFIQGWFDGIKATSYHSGIYGVFAEEQPLYKEYEQAIKDNKEVGEQMIIWTAHPQIEITSKEKAPPYEPVAPKGSFLLGWQYGIDAKTCNIDTNLFKGEIIEYLW